jgi:geranylgeranyl diphosphate synthase type I
MKTMIFKIKSRIEKELANYIKNLQSLHSLSTIAPVLYKNIKEFLFRKGKRVRPALFVISYLGFAKKIAPGFFRSAISLELLHDFMLVHDDIIDKSDTRRGKPSMHRMFNKFLQGRKNIKFNGEDLTIVAGDVMYAMALHAFLAVREDLKRKEAALKKLIEAALYTGSGEFIELAYGMDKIERITKEQIYTVYDLKTANYTFATPLCMGAILAGAKKNDSNSLFEFGICVGRAFQIKDDIIGIFGKESDIGKPNLTDLKESKKTILIWQAYRATNKKNKKVIKRILSKHDVNRDDLERVQKIILDSGALEYAKKEIEALILKAQGILQRSKMKVYYKRLLSAYVADILAV